jgi:hypothetical protein
VHRNRGANGRPPVKARFVKFRSAAALAGWPLRLEPARIPSTLLLWLDRPYPCDKLGGDILRENRGEAVVAGFSPQYEWC